MPTKVSAKQWFTDHVGQVVFTSQWGKNHPDGYVWKPGARTLQPHGKTQFELDGSVVVNPADPGTTVLEVTPDTLKLWWGSSITVYSTKEV